jgi:hypothetical protein
MEQFIEDTTEILSTINDTVKEVFNSDMSGLKKLSELTDKLLKNDTFSIDKKLTTNTNVDFGNKSTIIDSSGNITTSGYIDLKNDINVNNIEILNLPQQHSNSSAITNYSISSNNFNVSYSGNVNCNFVTCDSVTIGKWKIFSSNDSTIVPTNNGVNCLCFSYDNAVAKSNIKTSILCISSSDGNIWSGSSRNWIGNVILHNDFIQIRDNNQRNLRSTQGPVDYDQAMFNSDNKGSWETQRIIRVANENGDQIDSVYFPKN